MPIVFAPNAAIAAAAARAAALEAAAKLEAERERLRLEAAKAPAFPLLDALKEFRAKPCPDPLRLVNRADSKFYNVHSVDKNHTCTVSDPSTQGVKAFRFTVRYTPKLELQYAPQWG